MQTSVDRNERAKCVFLVAMITAVLSDGNKHKRHDEMTLSLEDYIIIFFMVSPILLVCGTENFFRHNMRNSVYYIDGVWFEKMIFDY